MILRDDIVQSIAIDVIKTPFEAVVRVAIKYLWPIIDRLAYHRDKIRQSIFR